MEKGKPKNENFGYFGKRTLFHVCMSLFENEKP